jgi:predicted unusual protein kinase regulating ubiquinone biosynthesis (AarF/ABC1/UbiB family)
MADVVGALGPLVTKLAQAATARPDLFSAHLVGALRSLQDRVAPEFIPGLPDGALLLASGSIAQVYACDSSTIVAPTLTVRPVHADGPERNVWVRAHAASKEIVSLYPTADKTHEKAMAAGASDRRLVVKIQRPSVPGCIAVDRVILGWLLRARLGRALVGRLCRRPLAIDAIDHLMAIVDGGLMGHLNFEAEALHAERMRAFFAGDSTRAIRVPATSFDPTMPGCLFMERIDGVPISQLATPAARAAAAHLLTRSACRMIFELGLVHGDIHQGNVLCADRSIDRSGRSGGDGSDKDDDDMRSDRSRIAPDACVTISLLDMGVVYDISPAQRHCIAVLIRAAVGADPPDLLAACVYFGSERDGGAWPFARFCQGVAAAVHAGCHGSDLGALVDHLASVCADSKIRMDRDMIARIAPLVAVDSIARAYGAPSLTVVACSLYRNLFS